MKSHGTRFTESEAILHAGQLIELEGSELAEMEDRLVDWLDENFLPGELSDLARACSALITCCREAKGQA